MSIYRKLNKELQHKANVELNENPALIPEILKDLRKWLDGFPDFNACTDNQWLLAFLRCCKFDIEKTKSKLKLLYSRRIRYHEYFRDRDPLSHEMQEFLKSGPLLVVPETQKPTSPRTIVIRTDCTDPKITNAKLFMKVFLMLLEILYLEDDNAIVGGISIVVDMQKLPFGYLPQLTPSFFKSSVECVLGGYPTRLKEVHFVNSPYFFKAIFKILWLFVPEKISGRIKFLDICNDSDNISVTILPNEIGGNGRSFRELAENLKAKMESHRDWFLKESIKD